MSKKYEITDRKIQVGTKTLYQIRALKNGVSFYKDQLGGYVEGPHNLTQTGDAWISQNAKVFDKARVRENAHVRGFAEVSGCAVVGGSAVVSGHSQIKDRAAVGGHSTILGSTLILDRARIQNSEIHDSVQIAGSSVICDSTINNNCVITGHSNIGKCSLSDHTQVHSSSLETCDLSGFSVVDVSSAMGYVTNLTAVDARINDIDDYVVIGNIGSENGQLDAWVHKSGNIYVSRGCFSGSLEAFKKAVSDKHSDAGTRYFDEYMALTKFIEVRFKNQLKKYQASLAIPDANLRKRVRHFWLKHSAVYQQLTYLQNEVRRARYYHGTNALFQPNLVEATSELRKFQQKHEKELRAKHKEFANIWAVEQTRNELINQYHASKIK